MIRVLLLTDYFLNFDGGAEQQIFALTEKMDPKEYEFHIITLETDPKVSVENFRKVKASLNHFPVKRMYGFSGLRQAFRLSRYLKINKIDIVMTYHFMSDTWGSFVSRCAGVDSIISNRRDMGFWRNDRHIKIYKITNRWVKRVVANTNAIKNKFTREEGLKDSDFEIIFNGIQLDSDVDNSNRMTVRQELGMTEKDIVIMHVSSIKPVKAIDYLLEAFGEALKVIPNLKIIFVGHDAWDGHIQEWLSQKSFKNKVQFLGHRKDIRRLLQAADFCTLTSDSEGMSNAVMEYMAAGKAVIATNVGGNPDLIEDNVHGRLVEKRNVQQLIESIKYFAHNPGKAQEFGDNGAQRIREEFSMDNMLNRYDKLFRNVLELKK